MPHEKQKNNVLDSKVQNFISSISAFNGEESQAVKILVGYILKSNLLGNPHIESKINKQAEMHLNEYKSSGKADDKTKIDTLSKMFKGFYNVLEKTIDKTIIIVTEAIKITLDLFVAVQKRISQAKELLTETLGSDTTKIIFEKLSAISQQILQNSLKKIM